MRGRRIILVALFVFICRAAGVEGAPQRATVPPQPVPLVDVSGLKAAHDAVARAAARLPGSASLADLLRLALPPPDTAGVRERVADEHRAFLLVVAFYVNGWRLSALVPEARAWTPAPGRRISLGGRQDLAQHFSVSAAITAAAGSPLADAAGLYKELRDARGGSGFSFDDLAADRAGKTFGHLATESPDSARRFRARLAAGISDAAIMPSIAGLASGLPEADFKRRYGGVGARPYNAVVAEIDQRIAALEFYQLHAN